MQHEEIEMADETIEELQAKVADLESQLANAAKKGPDWRNLEKERDTARDEATRYKGLFETARGNLIQSAVQVAGFKPNDEGEFEGAAGLVVEKFQSSLGDEDLPDVNAFVEMAERYGVKPAAAPGDGQAPTNDLAAALAASQAGGEAIAQFGQPPRPADLDTKIREAEAAGDVQASIALKAQKLRAMASL